MTYKTKLVDSLENGIKEINREMNAAKKSIGPIGLWYFVKVLMSMPRFIIDFGIEDSASKMTLGFSNVPGPKTPWVMDGKENRGIGFIMPTARSIVGAFSIISHADCIKVCISMDRAVMTTCKPMSDIFKKNLDEMLGVTWREFHE